MSAPAPAPEELHAHRAERIEERDLAKDEEQSRPLSCVSRGGRMPRPRRIARPPGIADMAPTAGMRRQRGALGRLFRVTDRHKVGSARTDRDTAAAAGALAQEGDLLFALFPSEGPKPFSLPTCICRTNCRSAVRRANGRGAAACGQRAARRRHR